MNAYYYKIPVFYFITNQMDPLRILQSYFLRFFSLPYRPDRHQTPKSRLCNRHPGSLAELKLAGRNLKHSYPSNSEVKNEWVHTSAPPIRLHGMDKEHFTFPLLSPIKTERTPRKKNIPFQGLKKRFPLPVLCTDLTPVTRGEIKVS